MKKQSVAVMQPAKEAAPMKLLPGSDLFDRIQDMSNSIARRAFEIFEDRGRAFGHDLEDWLRAESEFLHPIHLDIAESDDAVTVRAEVPGFSAKELEVGVEPYRLTISGKREANEERQSKKTIYAEHCRNQVFRTVDGRVAGGVVVQCRVVSENVAGQGHWKVIGQERSGNERRIPESRPRG